MVRRRVLALIATLTFALLIGRLVVEAALDIDSPSPAQGHAEVIAHGVVTLPDGLAAWRVETYPAETKEVAESLSRPLSFILADKAPFLVTDTDTGDQTRLAGGEAMLVRDGANQLRTTLGDSSTPYYALELVNPGDVNKVGGGTLVYGSKAFSTPSGAHDLDLVRDVLKKNETGQFVDPGTSYLLLVTSGALEYTNGESNSLTKEIKSGKAELLTGELKVKATDGTGATYVVAVIGPEIPESAIVQPTQPTPTPAANNGTVLAIANVCVAGFDPAGATTGDLITNCSEPLKEVTFHLTAGDIDSSQDTSDGRTAWDDVPAGKLSLVEESGLEATQIACSGKWDAQPDGTEAGGELFAGDTTQKGLIDYDFKQGEQLTCNFFHPDIYNGTGSVSFRVHNCQAGMTADTLDPDHCQLTQDEFDFGLSSPHQVLTRSLADATFDPDTGIFTWADLPFRPVSFGYGVGENPLPSGYESYVMLSDGPIVDIGNGDYSLDLTVDYPDILLEVYNFAPDFPGSVTIHILVCPAGMTAETLDSSQCEATPGAEENPEILLTGAGPVEPNIIMTSTADGYRWDGVPFYGVSIRDNQLPAGWTVIADGLDGDPAGSPDQLPHFGLTPDSPNAEVTLYYFPPEV